MTCKNCTRQNVETSNIVEDLHDANNLLRKIRLELAELTRINESYTAVELIKKINKHFNGDL